MPSNIDEITIEKANEIYIEQGAAFYSDDAAMVAIIQSTGWDGAMKNLNFLHALSLTGLMFDTTKANFRMLTGQACDGFVEILNEKFIALLQRLKEIGGKARIIVVDAKKDEPSFLKNIIERFPDTLKVERGRSGANVKIEHFIACDGHMLRKEKYHDPITNESMASDIKADVYFQNESETVMAEDTFDIIWNKLSNKS